MKELALDKDGYLRNHLAWNSAVAVLLAGELDIQLTPEHWQIIELARQFYLSTDVVPETRPLVKLTRDALDQESGTSIYLMQLFKGSFAKNVAKIAGLPRPTNCL
ncbi:MAG: tRNA 2-thiouridine synthesizing protein E [Candidatus Azotimanducaceae bacterium]|jgi:tRNA 2-thiouridine synthesizing protein E|tara:strand:- start:387 stop:701 length:315 start_codon:yes stop_codon:yes gene_type:complete